MKSFLSISIIIFIILVFVYCNIKKSVSYYKQNVKNDLLENNKIKVLTYNIQRLPYLFNPSINLNNLLENYDIVFLQEDFFPDIEDNFKFNICHIGTDNKFKLIDSGISIYSRIPLQYIDFIPFSNLTTVDKLSDKGFLIMKINDIYLINIHLQSSYYENDNNDNVSQNQITQIINYIENNFIKKFIIIGDFNVDINLIKTKYSLIIPHSPTHYRKQNSMFYTSAFPIDDYIKCKYDGAMYNNLNIKNINLNYFDKYTDHLGLSLEILT